MASSSRTSRSRSRRSRAMRASGAPRWRWRAAGPMRCRWTTGASSAATITRRATWPLEVHAHLRALGITERIEAVVAVPADLDAQALASLRGALSAAGCDARGFLDGATLTAAALAEREHYVRARSWLAFGHGHARGRWRGVRLRRILRQRTRQPAGRLRPVAGRRSPRSWSRTRASIPCSVSNPSSDCSPTCRHWPRAPQAKAKWKRRSNPTVRVSP